MLAAEDIELLSLSEHTCKITSPQCRSWQLSNGRGINGWSELDLSPYCANLVDTMVYVAASCAGVLVRFESTYSYLDIVVHAFSRYHRRYVPRQTRELLIDHCWMR